MYTKARIERLELLLTARDDGQIGLIVRQVVDCHGDRQARFAEAEGVQYTRCDDETGEQFLARIRATLPNDGQVRRVLVYGERPEGWRP